MTCRSRRFGPSLEELDKKTLLSAGQLGHLCFRKFRLPNCWNAPA
jgi:hypothetical protein